ncbi:MAG TPA: bifunctional hydroxymethylpyrimidine kinase/phosphomethylpyrimidine kinase [Acidobacteriaceae bacterium]|jgi:hydroxymethylpyrimidine/phosphomethylpyrimidine kinase|nr:bifunctional hydroxymethylpyrimidine kinase/phosphomethylpyrimidine kinase [Acidobacteriaceae bacterium]
MGPETTWKNGSEAEAGAGDGERRPTVVLTGLTIAGFDPSSGAGVTADLQVFAAHGLFGVSAITSLTMQSTLGVAAVQAVDGAWIRRTLEHLTEDLPVAGIKIGMLGSEAAVRAVAEFLRNLRGRQGVALGMSAVPVVLDPVLRSSSGHELLSGPGVEALVAELLPLVGWATPNWAELAVLSGREVGNLGQAAEAAAELGRRYSGLGVVATGGDAAETVGPVDLLWTAEGGVREFRGAWVETRATHGTGCAFSSALLARLVLGDGPVEAVAAAKSYVAEAMRSAPGVGHGRGPLNLLWPLRRQQGS